LDNAIETCTQDVLLTESRALLDNGVIDKTLIRNNNIRHRVAYPHYYDRDGLFKGASQDCGSDSLARVALKVKHEAFPNSSLDKLRG
jgi:hypothetical protein